MEKNKVFLKIKNINKECFLKAHTIKILIVNIQVWMNKIMSLTLLSRLNKLIDNFWKISSE